MNITTPVEFETIGLCRDREGGSGLTPMIQRLEDERRTVLDFIERTVAEADAAQRDLSESERASLESSRARVTELDAQLAPMRDFAELRDAHRDSGPTYRPTRSEGTGTGLGARTERREHEYRTAGELMADAWRAQNRNDETARARLESVGLGFEGGMLVRAAPNVVTADLDGTTQGILPTPIVGSIFSDLDASRPFINSVGAKDLGGIPGKTFTRPFVTTHVSTAAQAAELATVQEGTFVIDDVEFTKAVYGGYVTVSRQSINWAAPSMWDGLLTDFQEIYGLDTENAAADAFATAVTSTTDTEIVGAEPTVAELLKGMYAGAVAVYNGSKALPDTIWQSLDEWALWGPIIDAAKAVTNGDGGGSSRVDAFTASMLQLPRIVVPSLASGTTIVGRKNRVEVYEDRYGFLSAVQPKVFGVDLAYGGEMASAVLKAAAFTKLTFTTTP